MKKYYLLLIPILAIFVGIPATISHAEDASVPHMVLINADGSVNTNPTLPGGQPQKGPGGPVGALKAGYQAGLTNVRNNEDSRNGILRAATSTGTTTLHQERQDIRDDRREDVQNIRDEGHEDMKSATSTMERRDDRRDMRLDIFKTRFGALVAQLKLSLTNLGQIRTRISTAITTAASKGKDMTSARTALVTADAKLTAAQTAVDVFAATNPASFVGTSTTATTTATTSPTVNLDRPRQIGAAAIKAVQDARQAFEVVVRAILSATTTATSTTGTTSPSAL